jgi:hypothetical protein
MTMASWCNIFATKTPKHKDKFLQTVYFVSLSLCGHFSGSSGIGGKRYENEK